MENHRLGAAVWRGYKALQRTSCPVSNSISHGWHIALTLKFESFAEYDQQSGA